MLVVIVSTLGIWTDFTTNDVHCEIINFSILALKLLISYHRKCTFLRKAYISFHRYPYACSWLSGAYATACFVVAAVTTETLYMKLKFFSTLPWAHKHSFNLWRRKKLLTTSLAVMGFLRTIIIINAELLSPLGNARTYFWNGGSCLLCHIYITNDHGPC